MLWDFKGDRPIYTQLIEQISLAVVSGVFPPGARLPSVRELAAEAGVNPNTMQRALSELEREGLVFSQRTSGRFITEDESMIEEVKNSLAMEQIARFLESMKRLGYEKEQVLALIERSGS